MKKYRRSLSDDLNGSLDEMSRGYIRKPVTVILSIIVFIVAIPVGVANILDEVWSEFTVKCWRGTQHER